MVPPISIAGFLTTSVPRRGVDQSYVPATIASRMILLMVDGTEWTVTSSLTLSPNTFGLCKADVMGVARP